MYMANQQTIYDVDEIVDCRRQRAIATTTTLNERRNSMPTVTTSWSPTTSEEPIEETRTGISVGRVPGFVLILLTMIHLALTGLQTSNLVDLSAGSTASTSNLGSAAIHSVTDALSPVLPFTGGLDLRRGDIWTSSSEEENWILTVRSVLSQVVDAFSSSSSNVIQSTQHSKRGSDARLEKSNRELTLSAQDPFVPSAAIAELTLRDVAELFRYMIASGKPRLDKSKLLKDASDAVKKVLAALENAVMKSRGANVLETLNKNGNAADIDALNFLAVMRIFGEWRVLRQVPEGYKGYEIGMHLGRKDIVQNVAKIEQAVHMWLDVQLDRRTELEDVPDELRSPSLRQLLQYEVETKVHPELPRLKDKTAGMGLLWVRRQLQYQTRLFHNVLGVGSRFSTTRDAVSTSYQEVYDRYHGWAVQKIFQYSFQSAPEAVAIYRHMNPKRLLELETISAQQRKVPAEISTSAKEFDMTRREAKNPWEAFTKGLIQNWKKMWNRLENGDDEINSHGSDNTPSETFVTNEIVKNAHEHISIYLDVVNPLLDDISLLFRQMNMDDPTKV